ncbi:MAG: hypothetical protein Q9168_001650 [Polycauliona sp. 1 TL-2023]
MPFKKAKPARSLPEHVNPLVHPNLTPEPIALIRERRLGQTDLSVRAGAVGTSNATKRENLGLFNYAHLKVPFPENFKGSEIHPHHPKHGPPNSYFLMRRSNDGYISASGMFKAAFPWATQAEEKAEKEHVKSLESTSREEVAGNIWVTETTALDLAEDYGICAWVEALLAPDDVFKGSENYSKSMTPPPKFIFTANDRMNLPPPSSRGSTPARARGRPRAGSPTKSEKAASPRKQRVTKASRAEDAANTRAASASLQDALTKSVTPAIDEEEEEEEDEGLVRVELNESTQVNGEMETTTTNVKINLPGGMAGDIPPQEQTEEIIREAKAVVEAARKLEGNSSKTSKKRKAEELDVDSEEEADGQLQPAKKVRLAEQELRKERVKNRALFGVAFTLAVGSILPYLIQ